MLKTTPRLSATVTSIFSIGQWTHSPFVPPLLPPSSFPTTALWRIQPPAWQPFDAPRCRTDPLATHTCPKVWRTWRNWRPRARPTHPQAKSIPLRPLIKPGLPKHRKGSAATERDSSSSSSSSSSSLCIVINVVNNETWNVLNVFLLASQSDRRTASSESFPRFYKSLSLNKSEWTYIWIMDPGRKKKILLLRVEFENRASLNQHTHYVVVFHVCACVCAFPLAKIL